MSKTIFLKQLSLKNFKGIRSLSIDFKDKETVIAGANATGKTTVFDSFMWLLFGKDSNGNSDQKFNIKTMDENGKPILNLEHEVSAVLEVSGQIMKLKRVYLEKWEKPRGTSEETLKSHYTEFYLNDVKLSTKREYDDAISSIIQEDVFKMITNPFYFNSLTATAQKEMLFDMAGNVSDDYVASKNPEFYELLSQLTGKSLETFKKEISAKKRAIKDELDQLPARIDTAKQLMPESEIWDDIENEISDLKSELSEIEAQIADNSKQIESEYKRKSEIRTKIGKNQVEQVKIENNIKIKAQAEQNSVSNELNSLKNQLSTLNNQLTSEIDNINALNSMISRIDIELEGLRVEYRAIDKEQLNYPEGAFVCPTCQRPLELDDIEAKQIEMQANFNEKKADRLKENQKVGKSRVAQKEKHLSDKVNTQTKIDLLRDEISAIIGKIAKIEAEMPNEKVIDIDALIKSDQQWIDLGNEITELENQLTIDAKPIDTSSLKEKKLHITDKIVELTARIKNREVIERTENLIKKYEESKAENNQALADLERMEFISLEFQKAKDNELMNRINGMFRFVKFSFIDEQLNGGEKIACNCLVNTNGSWVPFAIDANRAGTINAGLDIINAICKYKGVTAPIFIDNRESVNTLIPTDSQIINLYVSNHNKLSIRSSADGEIEMYTEL